MGNASPEFLSLQGRAAVLQRHRPGSPEAIAARRDAEAQRLADYIERVVATAPPLTTAQQDRLVTLLRGGAVA